LKDLNKLWKDGVMIFDVYLKEYFIIPAIIFCMINDLSAYDNLLVCDPFSRASPLQGDELRKKDTEIPLSVHWGIFI
jgi:hypothetical protein